MSEQRFIELLQALLTMVDSRSKTSMKCAKNTLENIFAMAQESGKCDSLTLRMMYNAITEFEYLVELKEDFAGIPKDYSNNLHKRQRLAQMLRPSC